MSIFPAAVIMVNNDLTDNTQQMLVRQLGMTLVLDGYTFDGYVQSNPNYISQLKAANMRVMVIESLQCPNNEKIVDLVLFIKAGMVNVIRNNLTGAHVKREDDFGWLHGYYKPGHPYQKQPQPQPTCDGYESVRTKHHLYPDQLFGLQFKNYELGGSFFHEDSHPAMTLPIVNLTWGALGIYTWTKKHCE